MVGFAVGAIVVSELAANDLAYALFEDWERGPLSLVGVHTWSATRVPVRIHDAGPSVDQVSDRLVGALAVRIAPRICQECREERAPTVAERAAMERVGHPPSRVSYATGCAACGNSGARGEVALSEWMEVTPELRDLLGEDPATLRAAAFPGGVGSAPLDGLRLVDEGLLGVGDWLSLVDSFG